MRSGSYKVRFSGGCGNAGGYAPQSYRGEANIASANPIVLTAGQTTSRINAAMQPGATLTGLVTDAAGNRLSRARISFVPVAGLQSPFFFFRDIRLSYHAAHSAANLDAW